WCRQALRRHPHRPQRGASEALHRHRKADVFDEHDELHHVAALAASEAVPTSRGWKNRQVWASCVGMQRTSSEKRSSLSLELDAVASHDIFDGMRLLEDIHVDPSRSINDGAGVNGHGAYAGVASSSGGRAYSQRDGW